MLPSRHHLLPLAVAAMPACTPPAKSVVQDTENAATGDLGATDDVTAGTSSTAPAESSTADEGGSASGASTGPGDSGSGSDDTAGVVAEGPTLYVHFDGGSFAAGGEDDAATNTSTVLDGPTELQPYAGSQADRDAIVARIRDNFAAFDLDVVEQRPIAGDYTMVVITATNFVNAGVLGISGGVDCGDANPNNVVFAFDEFSADPVPIADAASGRIGTTYGLANTLEVGDLMGNVVPVGGTGSFIDTCVTVDSSAGFPPCPEAAEYCPPGEQNAVAQLLAILGPA